jgi:predicted RNA binding protein YcfA (HicA-like mRNA interferase family)
MPPFRPVSQKELICYLHKAGFKGPFAGGKHLIMLRGTIRLTIPNPHQGDISKGLLAQILKRAEMTKDEWESL